MKLTELAASASKALAALGAGAAIMVTEGLLTGRPAAWLVGGIGAAAAAIAVYVAPRNKQRQDRAAALDSLVAGAELSPQSVRRTPTKRNPGP